MTAEPAARALRRAGRAHAARAVHRPARRRQGQVRAAGAAATTLLADGAGFSGPSIAGTGLPRTGPRARSTTAAATRAPRAPCPGCRASRASSATASSTASPSTPARARCCAAQLARLAERGWTLQTGIEPEFFLLRRTRGGGYAPADAHDRLDKPSYDLKSLPRQRAFLHELAGGAAGLRARRVADRPRGRARPVRAQLPPRRRAGQRRPPDAVQARRAGAGRAARHACSR